MRIAVPLLGGKKWMGGYYYARTFCQALRSDPSRPHEFVWLVPPEHEAFVPELERDGFAVRRYRPLPNIIRKASHLAGHRQVALERAALVAHADIVFPVTSSLGRRSGVPFLGWIVDFQHVHLPHFFSRAEILNRDRAMHRMVAEAPHIVVSSQHAKRTLLELWPRAASRVSVFRFPTQPDPDWYTSDPETTLTKYDIESEFIFLPNQFWIHKNHHDVFNAWARLGKRAPMLVCTGHTEDPRDPQHFNRLRAIVSSTGVEERIKFLGLIPRTDQIALYRTCRAVLNPSRYEGWSSTVEEARALGKPLILSDIPIFREQAPTNTWFFHLDDPQSLAELIERTQTLPGGVNLSSEAAARASAAGRLQAYRESIHRALQTTARAGGMHSP